MPNDGCGTGETYRYNVIIGGAKCSATDRTVSTLAAAGFVAPTAHEPDLHLKPGSPAIDAGDPKSHPRRDIFRRETPAGARTGRRRLRALTGGATVRFTR